MKKLLNVDLFGTFEYDSLILQIYSDNHSYFTRNKQALTSLGSYNSALYTINKTLKHSGNEDFKQILKIEKTEIVEKMLEIIRKLED